MKKALLATLCLSFSGLVFADATTPSSTIALLDKADLSTASNVTLPLDTLVKGGTYNVTCYMSNLNAQPVDVLFAVEAKNNLQYTSFSVNDTVLPAHNQVTLPNGESTISVTVSSNGDGNALIMKNLNKDNNSVVKVMHCAAKPTTVTKLATNSKALSSGYFMAYNDTDKSVTIGVGNWFPTSYTIGPHNSRFVTVSSDNQNIHITKVE